jgi:pyridoxamine 5'-phosphate oxidase
MVRLSRTIARLQARWKGAPLSPTASLLDFEPATADDPLEFFRGWLDEAAASELNDANAMALATSTPNGSPSVRMVLMKRLDERGFSFYTNIESQKGRELLANPQVALLFHWKSRRRQVRVEGPAEMLPVEDAEAYFHSRSRQSQIGAVASQQSRPLGSRDELQRRVAALERQFPGEVPLPAYWRGFLVMPRRMEFWEDGPFRLHNRIVFTRQTAGWQVMRLYP